MYPPYRWIVGRARVSTPPPPRGSGGDDDGGGDRAETARPNTGRDLYGEADQTKKYDPEKLRAALAKEERFQREHRKDGDDGSSNADRKRKYNTASSFEVTEEEMEAYRMKKSRATDDPMANLLNSDEVLPQNG